MRLIDRRDKNEATGEVLTLNNRMLGTKMGDRHLRSKPAKSEEKKAKRAKRDEKEHSMKVSDLVVVVKIFRNTIRYGSVLAQLHQIECCESANGWHCIVK